MKLGREEKRTLRMIMWPMYGFALSVVLYYVAILLQAFVR